MDENDELEEGFVAYSKSRHDELIQLAKKQVLIWFTSKKKIKNAKINIGIIGLEARRMETVNIKAFSRAIGITYETLRKYTEIAEQLEMIEIAEEVTGEKFTTEAKNNTLKRLKPTATIKQYGKELVKQQDRSKADIILDNLIPHMIRIKDNIQSHDLSQLDPGNLTVIYELCEILTKEINTFRGVVHGKRKSSNILYKQ